MLIKASPVFEAMFNSGVKEVVDGVLPIKDLDFGTVHSMLKFAYTDELADNMDAAKLLVAANRLAAFCYFESYIISFILLRFQMDRPKQLCADVLMASLAVENACEMLSLGDDQHCSRHAQWYKEKRNGKKKVVKKKVVKKDVCLTVLFFCHSFNLAWSFLSVHHVQCDCGIANGFVVGRSSKSGPD